MLLGVQCLHFVRGLEFAFLSGTRLGTLSPLHSLALLQEVCAEASASAEKFAGGDSAAAAAVSDVIVSLLLFL
jgi:hypothetical protein